MYDFTHMHELERKRPTNRPDWTLGAFAWAAVVVLGLLFGGYAFGYAVLVLQGAFDDPGWKVSMPKELVLFTGVHVAFLVVPPMLVLSPFIRSIATTRIGWWVAFAIVVLPLELLLGYYMVVLWDHPCDCGPNPGYHSFCRPSLGLMGRAARLAVFVYPGAVLAFHSLGVRAARLVAWW